MEKWKQLTRNNIHYFLVKLRAKKTLNTRNNYNAHVWIFLGNNSLRGIKHFPVQTSIESRSTCCTCRQLRRQMSNEENKKLYRTLLNDLRSNITAEQFRANDIAQLKGFSIWMTALPLAKEGYTLSISENFMIDINGNWNAFHLTTRVENHLQSIMPYPLIS